MDIAICIATLIVLMVLGIPIPFCFAGAITWMVAYHGYDPSFLMPCGFSMVSAVVLLAVPLFILFGTVVEQSDIADRLLAFINSIVGHIKGGLGVVVTVASGIFGAMSGAAAASVSAMGVIMVPRMEKAGYPRGYAASLVTCSALLSLLIPPSGEQILFAFVTGQSVAGCFLAIVGPGVMLMIFLSFINLRLSRSMPLIAFPKVSPRQSLKMIGMTGLHAIPALSLPVLILGSIYGGICTATEAAAIAIVGAILVGFFAYHSLSLKKLGYALREAGITTGTIMVLVFFAVILSRILIVEQLPQKFATVIMCLSTNKYVILLLLDVMLILLGMIVDATSAILLVSPLLLPLMKSLGVHPFQFAAIIGTNLSMGNLTPPVAPILYFGSRIGKVSVDKMLKPTFTFITFGNLPVILITTFWPELSLFLPRLAGYI